MDRKTLEALDLALRRYSINDFLIDGEEDWYYGIAPAENEGWINFCVDRGKRQSIHTFSTLYETCIDLIMRLAKTEETKIQVSSLFIEIAYPRSVAK